MKLIAGGQTDIGRLRSNNQDCLFVDTQLGLFIVADGMGGHAAGEVASALAVAEIRARLAPQLRSMAAPAALAPALSQAIHQTNLAVLQAAKDHPAWRGMGTTLTVLLLRDGQALLGHVGDSRLYRWRAGLLEQISDDHSLVGDQLRRGVITRQEAETSNLRNILLQAIGISSELEICEKQLPLQPGDRFLLCSDGLTGMLNDERIAKLLGRELTPEQDCALLMEQALAAGGEDNISALLVRVEEI
jgi:protein phosphatase